MPLARIRVAIAAACLSLLAACGQNTSGALNPVTTTEAELVQHIDRLLAERPKLRATAAVDIASVVAALPDALSVSYAEAALDSSTGATVLTDVVIAPAEDPSAGLRIAKLSVWALNAELARARLRGERLDVAAPLARRIEAEGISAFGLDAILAAASDAAPAGAINFGIERILLEDVRLRPWRLTPAVLPADSEFAEIMPVLQAFAAFSRSFAFDTAAMANVSFDMDLVQGGAPAGALDMAVERIAWRGQRGGDLDLGFAHNMNFAMTVPDGAPDGAAMDMSQTVKRISFSGLRLDKLYSWAARGEMPPRTETDLLSLGRMEMEDLQVAMQGKPIYSAALYRLDLNRFHWLIPTLVRYDLRDIQVDIASIISLSDDFGASFDPGVQPTEQEVVEGDPAEPAPGGPPTPAQVVDLLGRHGLARPSIDFAFGYDWNPRNGRTKADMELGLDNWARITSKGDLTTPAFDEVSALIPDDGEADEAALQTLFRNKLALGASSMTLIDEGGLAKAFVLAADLARLAPADDPAMGMFRSATPQSLRQMAVSGAYLAADTMGQQEPVLRDLLRPLAAWLDKGGRVEWSLAPSSPVTVNALEATSADPATLAKQLGLKVVHTPPPAN